MFVGHYKWRSIIWHINYSQFVWLAVTFKSINRSSVEQMTSITLCTDVNGDAVASVNDHQMAVNLFHWFFFSRHLIAIFNLDNGFEMNAKSIKHLQWSFIVLAVPFSSSSINWHDSFRQNENNEKKNATKISNGIPPLSRCQAVDQSELLLNPSKLIRMPVNSF